MHVSPLVEPLDDGRYRVTVSFHDPGAEDVWLSGGLAGADPSNRRLECEGDGWWSRSYDLGDGARLSYWFTAGRSDDPIADPLNPLRHVYPGDPEISGDDDMTVSLVELPGAPPLRWSVGRGAPSGEVETHRVRSSILQNERRVFTYAPAAYDPAVEYPLVVCFDGRAYVGDAYVPLPTVLDNLIADGAIPPVVAVLPDCLDTGTRWRELQLHEPFVAFLTDELLPWARERLSFADDPARTVVAGSSLGGLTAAYCGLKRPDVFGLVLSQSGAFQIGGPSEFATTSALPLRFHLDVGVYETRTRDRSPSLYHANIHMRDVLVAKGNEVTFREYPGGHDYFWWRETIADGLVTLLG
jgi:enterochelin esterase family protein